MGFYIKSTSWCLKPELQDDYAAHHYSPWIAKMSQGEANNTESAPVDMNCTGIMTTVNTNNNVPIQICDDNIAQSDAKHTIPSEGVCLKHKHTYCEDDTYPSASTLTTACECKYGETDGKPDKSMHCVEAFTRLDSLVRHISGDKPYKCDQCMK
jgi:hypothetical protein